MANGAVTRIAKNTNFPIILNEGWLLDSLVGLYEYGTRRRPPVPRDKSRSGPDNSSTPVKTHTHLLSLSFIVNKLYEASSAFIETSIYWILEYSKEI